MPRPAMAYVVPFCVFFIYLCLVAGEYFYERQSLESEAASVQIEQLKKELFRMQHLVEKAVGNHNLDSVAEEISLAATDFNIMVYILLDDTSLIRHANHVVWRDSRALQVIDGYSMELQRQVVNSGKPLIFANPDRLSIQAYYPIAGEAPVGFGEKVELIYLEYDLSPAMAKVTDALNVRFMRVWGLGALFVLGFMLVLHFMLIRPLRSLVWQARKGESSSFHIDSPWLFSEIRVLQDYLHQSQQKLQRTLKQLRDNEQRWLFAVEGTRNGIWDWNIASGEVFLSDRWKEMIGYGPHELEGLYSTWESRLHPDDREAVLSSLQAYLNGETEAFESVHRLRHKEGHYIWVLDRGMLVEWDEQGRPCRIIGTHADVSDDVRNQQALAHLANHDALTNLANRRALMDALYEQQKHCHNSLQCAALFLIDLDNFKTINDTLGHHLGDRLLIQLAARFSGYFTANTLVARLGGDEFVILAKDLIQDKTTAARRALALASEIRLLVARPFNISDKQLHVSASIGVCLFDEQDDIDAEELLKRADMAMFQAKEGGRDNCMIYNSEMEVKAHQNLLIQNELRYAIERQQLSLVYQPIVDSQGQLTGAEALLRWQHPQQGNISPADFIPIAEGSGLISEIGHWVILEVCRFIREQQAKGIKVPKIAINLSARQFNQPEFVERLIALLKAQGIATDALELELTEYALLTNLCIMNTRIDLLKKAGISVAIDDFGTGYSSLSYLQNLPLSRLKIDASFVQKIGSGRSADAIVRAIVEMAHSLELKVVAEGVETAQQRAFLNQLGCDSFQGYLFSQPLSETEFATLLHAPKHELLCAAPGS
ncbi:putative bifunctional diguanylate cyclase/phosphodiesterase [Shewanella algae]|uniref:putative bifunctional diguanylate cyclase/phosphodiesterase n=1 Tax=Shewanella algae TaxID=38313 RepID=UPI001F399A36|nr:GGDEF domain-containing phosphodiesterase [Shewanella algae]